ncbi:MAG: AAA family ATPase [Bacteroidales bacterium]|nr:AAA family ATPase [Bacteroidales bacterium]
MKHYYLNLPKDNPDIEFKNNMGVSTAIQKTAEDAFTPFEEYLNNAIKNLKKKDDVKAHWVKINEQNIAELQLDGRLFEITTGKNHYKINAGNDFEPDFDEPVICKINGEKKKINVSKQQWNSRRLELDFKAEKFDSVTWAGDDIDLELIPENKNLPGVIIKEDGNRKIVFIKDKDVKLLPDNKKEIQGNKIAPYIDFDNLKLANGNKFDIIEHDNLSVTLKNESDYNKTVRCGNLSFKVNRPQKRDKDYYWIQLLEIDDFTQNDEAQIFSPLRYFFDDDITIKDGNKENGKDVEYEVAFGKEDENKVVLRKANGKSYEYCFPTGSVLTVKVNTYQLEKQLEAISTLKQMPVGAHANLIKLFENRDKTTWQSPNYQNVNSWEVLTDDTRSGCYQQRNFVNKALNTPDFAILEGPPGSGKTTVILELICQIIKQGKRILLCGSTHVAIDNVLERLKERKFLEKFNILPVRIGDEKRINEDVKEFQLDNLIDENGISEDFLLEASNLVCGTTIGILRNPKFRDRKRNTPVVPDFDYLIIDESSKTTFQEFLVPALYAKKWILAGDCMQLSPFTDRGEIVSNISQSGVDPSLQQAIFYLQKLKDCTKEKTNKFILPTKSDVLKYIGYEIIQRSNDFGDKLPYILHNENIEQFSKLELYAADLIFIDQNLLKDYLYKLPETHAILCNKSWTESQHAFEHHVWQKNHKFYFKDKGKELNDSFEIVDDLNKYFIEKNWAEEVAWRIDREHQLRLAKGKNMSKSYSEQIENLLPKSTTDSIKTEEKINQIAAMAFPSILESLVQGIKGRKTKVESTISEGFEPYTLNQRRETLVYQHRMHPDISKFPRERFYQDVEALKDSDNLERDWNYNHYNCRSVWVDVKGKTIRNYNDEEVKILANHLEIFINFAKHNPQPEGKKWTVAVLTFYRGQETKLRDSLRKITGKENSVSDFNIDSGINIKLHTVDKFQGHEADIVFLSMVQTQRDGFMDNPNRLNVAITRAKFQLVIIGNYDYFSRKSHSDDLRELAKNTTKI